MTGSVTNAALSRRAAVLALLGALCAHVGSTCAVAAEPVRIVALGDSLTAGLGLAESEAFPVKLEAALKPRGQDVRIANAGVSGDTASAGLARLDWSVPDGTDAVILELGANDALRGVDPAVTRKALDTIIRRLKERRVEVLLAGMRAPRNLGGDYYAKFDRIYPDLAKEHGLILYPFFLDGVATDAKLNQRDGLHPTAAGVDAIVARMLPAVEALIGRVRAKQKS
ncbi:MAG: arylesterase [Xanthobacteraceae bacterium]